MVPGSVRDRTAFLLQAYEVVKKSGFPNFVKAKVLLPSSFNFDFIEKQLCGYEDRQVIEFLKYGFPVDCTTSVIDPGVPKNHRGAIDFTEEVQSQLQQEVLKGGCVGPFKLSPFANPRFSPLNSVPKKGSRDRRLILDLSFPAGCSINDGIDKDVYLGEYNKLTLPLIDKLVERVMSLGTCCKLYKVDLARGYKQIYICPADMEKWVLFTKDYCTSIVPFQWVRTAACAVVSA